MGQRALPTFDLQVFVKQLPELSNEREQWYTKEPTGHALRLLSLDAAEEKLIYSG